MLPLKLFCQAECYNNFFFKLLFAIYFDSWHDLLLILMHLCILRKCIINEKKIKYILFYKHIISVIWFWKTIIGKYWINLSVNNAVLSRTVHSLTSS